MTYSGGSFEPIETGSPLDNIQQNFQSFETGLAPVEEQAESDLRRKTELDMHKFDDLIKFTDQLKPFLEEKAKDYIKKKNMVDMDQSYNQFKANPDSSHVQDALAALEKKDNHVFDQEKDTNTIMKQISKDDYFASREFRKLSPYSQNALIVQHTQQQLLVHANTMPDIYGTTNPVEASTALSKHRLKTFGNISEIFPNADKGFLYKHVYQPIIAREQTALANWEVYRKKEDKRNDQAVRYNQIETKLNAAFSNKNSGAIDLLKLANEQGKTNAAEFDDSEGRAKRDFWDFLISRPDLYSLDQLEGLDKQIIKHEGYKKDGEYLKVEFGDAERSTYESLVDARIAYNKRENDKLVSANQAKGNAVIKSVKQNLYDKNFKPTNNEGKPVGIVEWLKEQQAEFKSATGQDSLWIKQKIFENSPNQQLIDADRKNLTNLKNNINLRPSDLYGKPKVLVDEFLETANYQEQQRGGLQTHLSDFENTLANRHPNTKVGNKDVKAMAQVVMNRMETAVLLRMNADTDQDYNTVVKEELANANTFIESLKKGSGRTSSGYDVNQLSQVQLTGRKSDDDFVGQHWINAEYHDAIDTLNGQLGSLKRDALTTTFEDGSTILGDAERVEAITKGYGTLDYQPDPQLLYLAKHYNTDVGTILNTVRHTLGLDPVKSSYADAARQSIQNMSEKQLATQFPNDDEINARAFWTVFDPTPREPNSGDEYIKQLIPQFNEIQELVNASGINVDKGVGEMALNDNDIAMIAAVQELNSDGRYEWEDFFEKGSEANDKLMLNTLKYCVNEEIKLGILENFYQRDFTEHTIYPSQESFSVQQNEEIQKRNEISQSVSLTLGKV